MSKVLNSPKPKANKNSRPKTFKPKVFNDSNPYSLKPKVLKEKYFRTNTKGPMKIWVHKSKIFYATDDRSSYIILGMIFSQFQEIYNVFYTCESVFILSKT